MVESDREFEPAERWVLEQCRPEGTPVDVALSPKIIPVGLTRDRVAWAFEKLKREERVSGGLVRSDNAGWSILRLVCRSRRATT
jgi:hypothetical protein